MQIYNGDLNTCELLKEWLKEQESLNCGAMASFVGVVRDEDGISGLSFDIYEPLLAKWLKKWQDRAKELKAKIKFAHSKGDVGLGQSSFACAVISPKRRVALELLDEFVEGFKANAPIWKYDIKNEKRVYAKDRSHKLKGAGLLA